MKYRIYNGTTENIEPGAYEFYWQAVEAFAAYVEAHPEAEVVRIMNEKEEM